MTPVIVIGTRPVARFAILSSTALVVDGVKVTGTPRMAPDNRVAYMVTPLAENDASVSVPVCPASEICVTACVMVIEFDRELHHRHGPAARKRQVDIALVREPGHRGGIDGHRPCGIGHHEPGTALASLGVVGDRDALAAGDVPLADGAAVAAADETGRLGRLTAGVGRAGVDSVAVGEGAAGEVATAHLSWDLGPKGSRR